MNIELLNQLCKLNEKLNANEINNNIEVILNNNSILAYLMFDGTYKHMRVTGARPAVTLWIRERYSQKIFPMQS